MENNYTSIYITFLESNLSYKLDKNPIENLILSNLYGLQ